MGWLSQRASRRVLGCLAVIGAGGFAGLLVGMSTEPVRTSELSTSELSAAQIVAMRFSGDSRPTDASPVVPAASGRGYVLASVEPDAGISSLLFSPFPTYASPAASPAPPVAAAAPSPAISSSVPRSPAPTAAARPALPPQLASASPDLPAAALAYAAPDLDQPAEPVARPENPAAAKRAVQAPRPASPNPAGQAATSQAYSSQAAASASNAVLNGAQIASIRERLKLTSYQSQLWPPVESALRDIVYQGHPAGPKLASNAPPNMRGAQIDPNGAPVQRLKSAAFPLIMSLSEEQKQEVRTMVRLMGLENLASQF
jgi:hypothetical protein